MMAVGLKVELVRFWSSGLVEMSMFSWDFEVDSWLRFWRWNLSKLCVRTHDMTSRIYFGKINSILGSVVPLAMFLYLAPVPGPTGTGKAGWTGAAACLALLCVHCCLRLLTPAPVFLPLCLFLLLQPASLSHFLLSQSFWQPVNLWRCVIHPQGSWIKVLVKQVRIKPGTWTAV